MLPGMTDRCGRLDGVVARMDRALKVVVAAVFVGLLAGIGTVNVGYGLGTFVFVFLCLGGYEVLKGR
jgi:hypothetical protein